MNDRQAKRVTLLLVVISFFMLGLMILGLLIYTSHDSKQGPQGAQGPQGTTAEVDYQRVEKIVEAKVTDKVARIPAPKNGVDGTNGKDGVTPTKGIDYFDGDRGDPGVNGRTPEMRYNRETKSFETRLEGDDFWTVLLDVCSEFPVLCEVQ